jgi:Circularly permutated YpsA SLOG family
MARSRQNILSRNLRQPPYLQRTEWNVRDSDATVLFSLAPEQTGGSKKTVEFAKKHHKPWIHLAAGDQDIAQRLKDGLPQNAVEVLNVAGPRASKEPGIASFVILTRDAVFGF